MNDETHSKVLQGNAGKLKTIIIKSRENENKEISWFGHENLYPYIKAITFLLYDIMITMSSLTTYS